MITPNIFISGTTRVVSAHDTATEQSVVLYRGESAYLASESHSYLTRFLDRTPDASLASVRETFHTELD